MKLICATNFSMNADTTAMGAACLAARMNIPLLLTHVVDPSLYDDATEDFLAKVKSDREEKLQRVADWLRPCGASVETLVLEGSPAVELTCLAKRANAPLLVLSQVGAIAPTHWAAGSVADKITQVSTVPTLVLRDATPFGSWSAEGAPLRILVGYDFSPAARSALQWAAQLRNQGPCHITVAHVASLTNDLARNGWALQSSRRSADVIEGLLERTVQGILGPEAGDWTRCVVDADLFRPAARLMGVAENEECNLIVVGSSRKQGWTRLGSVNRVVVHSSRTNVVTVPEAWTVLQEDNPEIPEFLSATPRLELAGDLAAA